MPITTPVGRSPRRLGMFGDSILAGFTPVEGWSTKLSIATEIARQSNGAFFAPIANNKGSGGEDSAQMLARITDVDSFVGVFGVIVDFGINDFGHGLTDQQILDNGTAIFQHIRDQKMAVGFIEILPTTIIMGSSSARRSSLNTSLRAIVNGLGGGLPHVSMTTDSFTAVPNTNTDSAGTHPNIVGAADLGGTCLTQLLARGW